jgi:hypothetical protein
VVHVLDLRHPVVALERDGVETALLAHDRERRRQAREALHRGVRPHELVVVEDHRAVDIPHRHYGFGEIAARPRGRCPLLGAHRVGVDVLVREALTSLAIRQYGR